jgi:hypothetical protein
MILKELNISLMEYGPQKGLHVGRAKFAGSCGEVTLVLNEHHIEEIFRQCADAIIETSRAAARHMTARVIEQQKALGAE